MNIVKKNFSFLFYDYETFGLHPALDKAAQFACIKTDINFNIIESKTCLYCFPPCDYLPNPEAVLLTGITPQYTKEHGLNEFFFSKKIFDIFNKSNTCIIGYNNIQFDDEVTRNIFYRNFLDPYSWSWQNGNSRWDVICLIRACYILTPHNIFWPKNKLGYISFKLEDFTKVNNIHHHAHDALSDVYATIDVIRFIKQKKPELFNFLLKYRIKDNIKTIINVQEYTPLLYISHVFFGIRNNNTCIAPIFWSRPNIIVFFDLYMDIEILIQYLNTKSISDMDMKTLNLLGISTINISKCPILIPINFFTARTLFKFKINIILCLKKICLLKKKPIIVNKIRRFFENYTYNNVTNNVDLKIYDSFFSQQEKNIMRKIHSIKLKYWRKVKFKLHTNKLREMFFRLRARNFPNLLDQSERVIWKEYCLQVLSKNIIDDYLLKLQVLLNKYNQDHEKYQLLLELKKYVFELTKEQFNFY